jgi:hypothetical protein
MPRSPLGLSQTRTLHCHRSYVVVSAPCLSSQCVTRSLISAEFSQAPEVEACVPAGLFTSFPSWWGGLGCALWQYWAMYRLSATSTRPLLTRAEVSAVVMLQSGTQSVGVVFRGHVSHVRRPVWGKETLIKSQAPSFQDTGFCSRLVTRSVKRNGYS